MKYQAVALAGICWLAVACVAPQRIPAPEFGAQPKPTILVSRRYSLPDVAWFQTYKVPGREERLIFVHLRSGETFPMLCNEEEEGLDPKGPIGQMVLANREFNRWEISAYLDTDTREFGHYELVTMPVSLAGEELFLSGTQLKRLSRNPRLLR